MRARLWMLFRGFSCFVRLHSVVSDLRPRPWLWCGLNQPIAVVLALFGCVSIAEAKDEAPRATLASAAIRERILAVCERMESVQVEYRLDDLTSEDRTTPPERRGSYLHRVTAAKQPARYYQLTGHGSDRYDWHHDRFRVAYYLNEGRLVRFEPSYRAYRTLPLPVGGELPDDLKGDLFFVSTGWWLLSDYKLPRLHGEPYMLLDIARQEGYGTVRPLLEMRDGRWCHVLEHKGVQALWIDVERGCAVMARSNWDSTTGALMQEIQLGGYRHLSNDIWIPGWIINRQLDYTALSPSEREREVIHSRATIISGKVNDVEGGVFRFTPTAGAIEIDEKHNDVRQVVSGSIEMLDDLAVTLQKSFPRFQQTRYVHMTLFAVCSFIVSIEFCLWIVRSRKWRKCRMSLESADTALAPQSGRQDGSGKE